MIICSPSLCSNLNQVPMLSQFCFFQKHKQPKKNIEQNQVEDVTPASSPEVEIVENPLLDILNQQGTSNQHNSLNTQAADPPGSNAATCNLPSTSTNTAPVFQRQSVNLRVIPATTVQSLHFTGTLATFQIPGLLQESNSSVILNIQLVESHFPNFRLSDFNTFLADLPWGTSCAMFPQTDQFHIHIQTLHPSFVKNHITNYLLHLYVNLTGVMATPLK